MWPKATASSQSMPMWMRSPASWRPGMSRSLPRGAPVPTNTASKPACRRAAPSGSRPACCNGSRRPYRGSSRSRRRARLRGQPERRDVGAHQPAGLGVASRRSRPRIRAASGRSRRPATPVPRRCRRSVCRSSSREPGSRSLTSSRRSAATRLSRQMATGFSSMRVRRQAGSQGRSQVRPRIPGKHVGSRLSMYASVYCPCAISRMYSGTLVWAGHAHWQSTTLWK